LFLKVEKQARGCVWFDTDTHESLLETAEFVRRTEMRQGPEIACVEEVAYNMGYIDRERPLTVARGLDKASMGDISNGCRSTITDASGLKRQ
jgi:glucose-1-phosphate thymidylyltransferase